MCFYQPVIVEGLLCMIWIKRSFGNCLKPWTLNITFTIHWFCLGLDKSINSDSALRWANCLKACVCMCLVFYVKSSERQFRMNQSKNMLKTVSALFCPFPLLFSDEIPLDAIKSVHKSPLKVHNYRKKKITILTEHSRVAWEPIREALAQTVSGAVRSCSTAH